MPPTKGKELAKMLNLKLIDSDTLIEEQYDKSLQKILDDKSTLTNLMIGELQEIKDNFGDDRRTLINDTRQYM